MIRLDAIRETLHQAAGAIVSVLDVDVLIVDSALVRLVSTRPDLGPIGQPVDRNSVFAYALQQGDSFIIEDPRTHEACRNCGNKESCSEFAELCCPILVDGVIVGVIGLIAFDEAARSRMMERKESYLEFVRQMSGLIASKAVEEHQHRETEKLASELEILVEQFGQGVLISDAAGAVIRGNTHAYRLLGLHRTEILKLQDILPSTCMDGQRMIPGEHTLVPGKGRHRLLCTIRPIRTGELLNGYILMIEQLNEVVKTMNRMMGYSVSVDFEEIIGSSPQIDLARELARKSAKGSSAVLILGESGTGKELFARAIHSSSPRSKEPFVPINCAAIPDHLLESELFGYEEGAFSGARKGGKIGKFELADRGTLFLDEIGDMPLHLQTKLLRVLEEKMIDRVGSSERTPVNVRIIAATHQNIEAKVLTGEFRQDLFYRLNVIPVNIPPLRERTEDIPILARYFAEQISDSRGERVRDFSKAFIEKLKAWPWSGNVRELQNTMAYAIELTSGDKLIPENLPERMRSESSVEFRSAVGAVQGSISIGEPVNDQSEIVPIDVLEQREIQKALSLYGKDMEAASAALGISRATLYRKLKK